MIRTAFSYTKAKFQKWPIIEADEFAKLQDIVKPYENQTPYVWVKHPKCKILESFNWSFIPEYRSQPQVYSFPQCLKGSKKPVNWEALRLVPTNYETTYTVSKQPYISSYKEATYPAYIYGFKDPHMLKKFSKLNSPDTYCQLVKNKSSLAELYNEINVESPVFLIDADVSLYSWDHLDIKVEPGVDAYMFDVVHESTGITYADESVQLVTPEYLNIKRGFLKRKPVIKHVQVTVGALFDLTDPFKAWGRSYYTFMFLKNTSIDHLKQNKSHILGKYIELQGSKKADTCRAGVEFAEKVNTFEDFDYVSETNWDTIEKRYKEWKANPVTREQSILKKRLEKAIAIYGKDSDEYQKLSSQLEKSLGSL